MSYFSEIIPLLFSFFLSCTQNMSRSVVGSVPYAPQQLVSLFQTSFLFISCSVEVFLILFLSASLHVKL